MQAYPRDEHCQSAVGSAADPWRTPQARRRYRTDRYLIHDRDGAYGEVFIHGLRSIGIRDRPTSPRSPWQNGYAERLIGSIRRECLDHVIVFQRAPPPSPAALLQEILQWGPHASISGERCAGLARRRSRRAHSLSPDLGRTASPIWPDLIYDSHSPSPLPASPNSALR
jgi:transposase InsO family protein